ncbi:MAG: 3'-5' exonuclease [Pseudomonadota bacterium]
MSTRFNPTSEQMKAVQAFSSGKNTKISAFAGSGKTSTLKLLARSNERRRGLYLAFNKGIASEAERSFPKSVMCRTTHAVALSHVGRARNYTNDQLFSTLRARKLNVIRPYARFRSGLCVLEPEMVAHLVIVCVRRFCQSGDQVIDLQHVKLPKSIAGMKSVVAPLSEMIAGYARDLWRDMIDPSTEMPIGHDGYLKVWSMDSPTLNADYVLLDEAQDTNGSVLHLLRNQRIQCVYVGDRHQQIYGWRGAVNAMEAFGDFKTSALTKSFRFGPEIALEANRVLGAIGEPNALVGNNDLSSSVSAHGETKAILCRTNMGVMGEIIEAQRLGREVCVVGGTRELAALIKDVSSLQRGRPASHPELFGFTNWGDLVDFAGTEPGKHLRTLVSIVERHGTHCLMKILAWCHDDEVQDCLTISTAHKAKGCEWDSVKIADDFASSISRSGEIGVDERRLFYVAITRAKRNLVINLDILTSFQKPMAAEVVCLKEYREGRFEKA